MIMQTAAGAPHEVQEGIEAGVFFYLTKPFEKDMLLAIVKAAVRQAIRQREALDDLNKQSGSLTYLQSGTVSCQNAERGVLFCRRTRACLC